MGRLNDPRWPGSHHPRFTLRRFGPCNHRTSWGVVSKPLEVRLPEAYSLEFLRQPENAEYLEKLADLNQDQLKKIGDWVIFPKALELLAEGRIYADEKNTLYIDDKPAPLVLS